VRNPIDIRIWSANLHLTLVRALAAVVLAVSSARAEPSLPATRPTTTLTVALLDFSTDTPGSPDLGSQLSDVLTASLGGQPGYTLVDRSSLTRVLKEHELSLTGIVDPEQGTKIGKLVGAKILVTGNAFVIDKQIFMVAKLIGTETSLVHPILVKGDTSAGMSPLILQLARKLITDLPAEGPKLIAADDPGIDPVPGLKKILSGKTLPKIAVRVYERHLPEATSVHADPAVEIELKLLLTGCGFTVIDGDDTDLAKAGVQVVITGEAFSELAAHIGNLVSCTDRIELKMTQFSDGKVLFADRDNNRAVDLSENLAGKLAMQKSARLLGIHVLQYFAEIAPAK
jgi:hypothetical protein